MGKIFIGLLISLLTTQVAMSADTDQKEGVRALHLLAMRDNPVVQTLTPSEFSILKATSALKAGDLDQSLTTLHQDKTLRDDPLAALLEAEVHRREAVLAVARAGHYANQLSEQQQRLQDADLSEGLKEADARLQSFMDKIEGIRAYPLDLITLSHSIHSVFLVDKARSRMFVYEQDALGVWQRVADEYVATGSSIGDKQLSGDGRTPNGVYRFVKKLSGSGLEKRYGPMAFPIDYPNALDALNHKTGGGIWMHGYAEGIGRRPPRDTKGCFALPNSRLMDISQYVRLGTTWVVVGENLRFGKQADVTDMKDGIERAIEAWRKDWTSLNNHAYLAHYHPEFHSEKGDLAAWSRYKRRINSKKHFIHVSLKNFTIIHVPDSSHFADVAVVDFDQDYRSDNYAARSRKRLYLVRNTHTSPWRILIEKEPTI